MTWNGEFVQNTLHINPPAIEGFNALLGLALRKNPKRAHLLVSTVLGKHIPQKPSVISAAAQELALQILVSTGTSPADKASWFKANSLFRLVTLMDQPERNAFLKHSDAQSAQQFTVFGYAETATGLGASVAEFLDADYIHSTRYPDAGAVEYGSFEEEHSHATAHHITPTNLEMLNNPDRIIVLVDDELSTGKTVMNTIQMFEANAHHEEYFVATLTDLRTAEAKKKFRKFEEEKNVKVTVVSLISAELDVPENAVQTAEPVIATLKTFPEQQYAKKAGLVFDREKKTGVAPVALRNGVSYDQLRQLEDHALNVAKNIPSTYQRTLVLGTEEDMYYPLLVARVLQETTPADVWFSSTTRSPVVTYHNDGYAIKDRVLYRTADNEKRYAYNIQSGNFDRIILLKPTGVQDGTLSNLVDKLKEIVNVVEVVETGVDVTNLKQPLYGPKFGSYDEGDVAWLLKDLEGVQLEAPLEEREEAIQSGGAHYAESLPVEYVPSDEYQELFKEALHENKEKLAEAVGLVSEQVYRLKQGEPVLVSLARAGTPVGVLMRRYLQAAYGYDAPHYAISIVRGKGIDYNALRYLAANHNPEDIIFVDGWTGKGAITKELTNALNVFEADTGIKFDDSLAVLADPGSCVTVYGTREDYLIPSACLNSTVSGLVSRTVLNDLFIQGDDYHGAKFYKEFIPNDVSNLFVDTISELFTTDLVEKVRDISDTRVTSEPDWSGWRMVEKVSEEYGINNVNLVKPGVGETTRVLLRRVPWRILIRPQDAVNLAHILLLAQQRGVEIEEREDLPYACIGLIHPQYTKGATGFDGGKA